VQEQEATVTQLKKRSKKGSGRPPQDQTLTEPRVSLENTLTTEFRWICSLEHGTTDTKPPSETSATPDKPGATKATQASAATPTEFMAETPLKPLKAVLETIREQADFALNNFKSRRRSVPRGGDAKIVSILNILSGPLH
jgi:hypothetical protein